MVFGGHTATGPCDDTHALALGPGTWQPLLCSGDTPDARWGHSATVYGDHMIVVGGRVSETEASGKVYQLNLRTQSWRLCVQ